MIIIFNEHLLEISGIRYIHVFSRAGIMIYIYFDELLPVAHKYGKHHITIYWLISEIIVIGISLMLL